MRCNSAIKYAIQRRITKNGVIGMKNLFVVVVFCLCVFLNATAFARTAPSSAPAKSTKTEAVQKAYSGNKKNHVFHKAGCRYFNCKACTERFDSAQEAQKAGYTPCKICMKAS